MALIEDIDILRRHIRNVFVTHDNSLISEMVLDAGSEENLSSRKWNRRLGSIRSTDRGSSNQVFGSYDMYVASEEVQAHKHMKIARHTSNASLNQVMCADTAKVNDSPDLDSLFSPQPYITTPSTKGRSSSFSRIMAKTKNVKNPFVMYGQYDAQGNQKSSNMVRLRITLTMCKKGARSDFDTMDICVVSKATVDQAIGLVLFQYCIEGREPQLGGTVDDYCLRHKQLDDDDDMLMFQPLASRDMIKKYFSYNFGNLLELALYKEDKDEKIIVKIHFDNKTHTVFCYRNMKVKMQDIFTRALLKRMQSRQSSFHTKAKEGLYVLEKLGEQAKAINLDSLLEDMATLEFRLIRTHSKRTSQIESEVDSVKGYSRFESLNYEVFNVQGQSRIIKKTIDIQLGISGEKIEIDPLTKSPLPPFKQKAETINCNYLISSEIMADRFNSDQKRLRLKITYLSENGGDAKEYLFECPDQGEHIHRKLTFIITQLQSKIRLQYFLHKKSSGSSSSNKLTSFLSSPFLSSSK